MDGTLLDSGASVQRAWRWTSVQLGLPFSAFEPYLHGIPAEQVLARVAPDVPAKQRASVAAEMLARQAVDTDGVVALPGAVAALAALPSARWAVVTSADRALAEVRLRAAGLPLPACLVTAELTPIGKPAPDPYRYAVRRLGLAAADCLVIEDSPAGVQSGRTAGCPVLGVLTSEPDLTGADRLVDDLDAVAFAGDEAGARAWIR